MKTFTLRKAFYALGILLAAAVVWMMRGNAITSLPVDYDEDDYLRAAQEIALVFQSGDLRGLMDVNYRPEHPPLAKIVHGPVAAALLMSAPVVGIFLLFQRTLLEQMLFGSLSE